MVMNRFRAEASFVEEPFRVIEFLISVPMFLYGAYMLTEFHDPADSGVLARVVDPTFHARIAGIVYLFTGLGLFLAARVNTKGPRRVATMVLFSSLLYSMIFRLQELTSITAGMLFIWIGMAVAAVDYINITFGRRVPSA